MKAWEIWTADIDGEHPVVLISHQDRIDHKDRIVVLQCRTMRPGYERQPKPNEVVLDQADGLDWKTFMPLRSSLYEGESRHQTGPGDRVSGTAAGHGPEDHPRAGAGRPLARGAQAAAPGLMPGQAAPERPRQADDLGAVEGGN